MARDVIAVKAKTSYMMAYTLQSEVNMKTDADWASQAKGLLKAELKRRNLSYADLAEQLRAVGVEETPENINNKIARGKFSAVFMVQCLEAIGCNILHLG